MASAPAPEAESGSVHGSVEQLTAASPTVDAIAAARTLFGAPSTPAEGIAQPTNCGCPSSEWRPCSAGPPADMPDELTHLGPGAAGPDLLAHCATAMAAAAQTVLSQPDSYTLMQYGPIRGDGRSGLPRPPSRLGPSRRASSQPRNLTL